MISYKQTTSVILVNGPPQVGKDTVADFLVTEGDVQHVKFAWPIKKVLPILFPNLPRGWFKRDVSKANVGVPGFGGTARDALIMISEDWIKPNFGDDFFGHNLYARISNVMDNYVVSDSGFKPEAKVLVDGFGPDNVYLMRLHREGCDFSKDSRSYIHDLGLAHPECDIENNGSKYELFARVLLALDGWGFSYNERDQT